MLSAIPAVAFMTAGRTAMAALLAPLVAACAAFGCYIIANASWSADPAQAYGKVLFYWVAVALVLSRFTDSYFQIAVAAIGFERAVAETYKTFCLPSHTCGKFAGKPVLFPDVLRRRRQFVPVFAAIWVLVIAAGVVAPGSSAGKSRLGIHAMPKAVAR